MLNYCVTSCGNQIKPEAVSASFILQCGLEQRATTISAGRALQRNKNKRALSLMKTEEAPAFSISAGCWPQRRLLTLSYTAILSPHFLSLLPFSQAGVNLTFTNIQTHAWYVLRVSQTLRDNSTCNPLLFSTHGMDLIEQCVLLTATLGDLIKPLVEPPDRDGVTNCSSTQLNCVLKITVRRAADERFKQLYDSNTSHNSVNEVCVSTYDRLSANTQAQAKNLKYVFQEKGVDSQISIVAFAI